MKVPTIEPPPLHRGPTPPEVFFNRRQILRTLGLGTLGLSLACGKESSLETTTNLPVEGPFPASRNAAVQLPSMLDSLDLTPREVAASHTNFYEFSPGRAGDLRGHASAFSTSPWQLEVGGACKHPRVFSLEDLYEFPHEERLYHFRCVERWAMNVPWTGIPLAHLLEEVEPTESARWVTFESLADRNAMPGIDATPHYPWPYHEALRLDEAWHDLTLLATGIYGAPLPLQHGAPMRLVVPWKYGYKSAKSLVKIHLVEEVPKTFWNTFAPNEYGLLSNVNPNLPHPRWSQQLSFWLRDDPVWPVADDTFPTPLFNGYEEQVAHLYPDEPRSHQRPRRPGEEAR